MVKLKHAMTFLFYFFLLTSGWGEIFQMGWTCNKDLNYKSCSLTGNCASRETFEFRVKSTRTNFTGNFHMNFTWKGFPVKLVWKSCELSHEFHVKLFHLNSLHTNFTWISDETSRKNHMKLFSREAQLAVLCIKKLKIMQNGQLKTVSLLFRRTWCILPSNTIMFALVDNVTIFSS